MTEDVGTATGSAEAGAVEAVPSEIPAPVESHGAGEASAAPNAEAPGQAPAPTPDPGEIAVETASHGAGVADPAAEPMADVVPESVEAPVPVSTAEVPVEPSEISEAESHGSGAPTPASVSNSLRDTLRKGLEKIRFRKRAKLEKIVALAREKGSIKNDDVEKLLHVSDATASRYLLQLVTEGQLKRSHAKEHAIYEPI